MSQILYVCIHDKYPHLLWLDFDQLPPDSCPKCNARMYPVMPDKRQCFDRQARRCPASLTAKRRDAKAS